MEDEPIVPGHSVRSLTPIVADAFAKRDAEGVAVAAEWFSATTGLDIAAEELDDWSALEPREVARFLKFLAQNLAALVISRDALLQEATQVLREPVLAYARKQADYVGFWTLEDEASTPIIAFTRNLEKHRSAISSLPQLPGLLVVQRPHSNAELTEAARRALGVQLSAARVVGTWVNARAGRPILGVNGEVTDEERHRLRELTGIEPEIVRRGTPRRMPHRSGNG